MAKIKTRAEFKDYCLRNKYTNWYFSIIDKALERNWSKKNSETYVEKHHIIPKSIVKNDEVVCLTAREHFICHLLLIKMLLGNDKSKMYYALHRLIFGNKKYDPIYVKNSKQYDNIKQKCGEFFSERNKKYWETLTKEDRSLMRKGKNNSMFGRKQKESTKQLISEKAKKRLEDKTKHPLFGVGHSLETKKLMSLNAPAKHYKFLYNNKMVEVFNLRKFCRDNDLDQGAMTRVNSGKQITHKGYSKHG